MTDGQSASLSWCRAPIWSPWPYFFSVWQLKFSWRGASSLTRGWVCNLLAQLLLGLARAVTLAYKSHRTDDHILLPYMRLLQSGGPGPRIYIYIYIFWTIYIYSGPAGNVAPTRQIAGRQFYSQPWRMARATMPRSMSVETSYSEILNFSLTFCTLCSQLKVHSFTFS
jgi:hypothetical protein